MKTGVSIAIALALLETVARLLLAALVLVALAVRLVLVAALRTAAPLSPRPSRGLRPSLPEWESGGASSRTS